MAGVVWSAEPIRKRIYLAEITLKVFPLAEGNADRSKDGVVAYISDDWNWWECPKALAAWG